MRDVFECVVNVSEGRDPHTLAALSEACGDVLLDLHSDVDHHRSVFTLAGSLPEVETAARRLALAVVERVDVRYHEGVHPRLGALDVVPFVALDAAQHPEAVAAARSFGRWLGERSGVPVFLYDGADPAGRSLPRVRREAFVERPPDFGPLAPHPTAGASAVGARPPLVAVNCELAGVGLEVATSVARRVRATSPGGLPGVRALGFPLPSRDRVQVSMNLVDLEATGLEAACTAVRRLAEEAGASVVGVELVGLLPRKELDRCSAEFVSWAELGADRTIEGRLASRTTGTAGRPGPEGTGDAAGSG